MSLVPASRAQDEKADQVEPPVRLKKKAKPEEEPPPPAAPAKKSEKPDADPGPEPDVPDEAKEKETLERIFRNVRTAEERLANREVGEGTRQIQRDILQDLDSLIELTQRMQNNPSDSDPSADPSQQKGSRQQARGGRRGSRSQAGRGQGRGQGQQGKPRETAQGNAGPQPGGGGGNEQEQMPKRMAEIFKDVWGHVPESLRAEMDAYAREQFMFKYKPVIERYYSAIAEQSRRKGD